MKKLQLRLLSVLCLAALLIACLPAAYAYGVCSAWAKPELDSPGAGGKAEPVG